MLSKGQIDIIIREYRAGVSLSDIAIRADCHYRTVTRRIRELNEPYRRQRIRPGPKPLSERDSEVVRLNALYDPQRDGYPLYENLSAIILGDPPIGRRELLKKESL